MLGLPANKVVVRCKRVGGAFGGKERSLVSIIAAIAAKKMNRPVRFNWSRKVDMTVSGRRHNIIINYDATIDKSTGVITEFKNKVTVDAGCSADFSPFWTFCVLSRIDGGYTLKNYEGTAKVFKTNSSSGTAFRGFGGPEGTYAIETIIEHLAHEAKMDPKMIREANISQEGDKLQYGDTGLDGCQMVRCYEECMSSSNYQQKKAEVDEFNKANKIKKRGVVIMPTKFPVSLCAKVFHQGGAQVVVYSDGSVLLHHGGIEMGQGLNTKMIQVAAR